ncbi:ABC transporter ATP-binding protein [Actinomycetospora soli]|uniref:ABC transporter ATP-binding protein n=1 Tax=Actinomycetospora soli TaxID=2893887 RepID=UPI001E546E0D|nr:ABC transporter ATP-binding protein [Actinomycetospora soli]MCD2191364.1 ABC transporter ATP-binding protein [Actinomycetospora soli]
MPNRSAKSGKYISNAAAARWPGKSVSEKPGPNRSTATAHRSASSGRYITESAAKRNPGGTVTENGGS